LIKKIRAVQPTTEQAKGRTPEYAFGWIDCMNAITEIVKNYGVLQNVSDSVCSNCDGYGYTVDENGRRKEHCDKC